MGLVSGRGLFISHAGERCGVYQFGVRMFRALKKTCPDAWIYSECSSVEDFDVLVAHAKPDFVLFNHHPLTLGWARNVDFKALSVPSFAMWHEANSAEAAGLDPSPFDYLICADPTLAPVNPRLLTGPRFIPSFAADDPVANDIFTIGSFGFATDVKNFDQLCALVNEQFDRARIRINIPLHDHDELVSTADRDGVLASCRAAITKSGVELELTDVFLSEDELLLFLHSNDINVFMYQDQENRGISSCVDYALAAKRPIAVNRSSMFRVLHHLRPSVNVEERPLQAIHDDGVPVLSSLLHEYSEGEAGDAWNSILRNAVLHAKRQEVTVAEAVSDEATDNIF